jgi:hypothetical protein
VRDELRGTSPDARRQRPPRRGQGITKRLRQVAVVDDGCEQRDRLAWP